MTESFRTDPSEPLLQKQSEKPKNRKNSEQKNCQGQKDPIVEVYLGWFLSWMTYFSVFSVTFVSLS